MNTDNIRRTVGIMTGRMPPTDVVDEAARMIDVAVESDEDIASAITDKQQVVLGMSITLATLNRLAVPEDNIEEEKIQ